MAEAFVNPIPGDEVEALCVSRQIERGVPLANAKRVCQIMQKALVANKLDLGLSIDDMVVVPVVYTREGVHNLGYKPWEEVEKAALTIEGTPFFINQPGEHINALPPLDDPSRVHGINLDVEADKATRTVRGHLGLLKPDVLKKMGASEKRVAFQVALLDAVQAGGRFPVSIGYVARVNRMDGVFNGRFYNRIESDIVVHSTSIVPRGAEASAIMNALTEEVEDTPKATTSLPEPPSQNAEAIEPSNTHESKSGPTTMAAPPAELAALANKVSDLTGELKTRDSAAEQARSALANALTSPPPANADLVVVANTAAEALKAARSKLASFEEAARKALDARVTAARKALANSMPEESIKALEANLPDPEARANTFELLSKQLTANGIAPPADPPAAPEPEANSGAESSFDTLVKLRKEREA